MKQTKASALVRAAVLMCATLSSALAAGDSKEKQVKAFKNEQRRRSMTDIDPAGLYEVRSSKRGGRKIVCITGDGIFALRQWKLLRSIENREHTACTLYVRRRIWHLPIV